jgi:hypothetical protein
MIPHRPTRLAPLLVVAGCLVGLTLAVYVGGYLVLGRHSAYGKGLTEVEFDGPWSASVYYPAVLLEAKLRRSPLVITCPIAPGTYQSSFVE